jgi:hypothetical protein
VTSLTYEQIATGDLPIDVNPNTDGGLRIYPDKKLPGENVDRRTIRVKAQYSNMTPNVRIYFRNFDVDDPSADTSPVDSNDTPAVKNGNDNRGNVDGTTGTRAGTFSAPQGSSGCQTFGSGMSCLTDSNGTAVVNYTLTMNPGDNFAVAASPDQTYLSGLVPSNDGINLKDTNDFDIPVTTAQSNGCQTQNQKACRADMLTVWRRLHIEVDSMGIVTDNKVTGIITNAVPIAGGTHIYIDSTPEDYRFEPGTIVIDQVGTYPVNDNVSNEVQLNALISPQLLIGKSFTLYDDDDFDSDDPTDNGDDMDDVAETSATFSRMQTENNPDKNVYAPAYIMLNYDGGGAIGNNTNSISFVLNLIETDTPGQISLGRNSASNEADNFWVAYFQVAYQPEINFDRDSDVDHGLIAYPSTLGLSPTSSLIDIVPADCSIMPIGGHGSFVFQEVIRDEFNVAEIKDNGLTAPHELGHQLGINGDGYGPGQKIMSRLLNPEPSFIPEHLNLLRCRVKSPGQP